MTKPVLIALSIAGAAVLAVSVWRLGFHRKFHRSPADIADALRRAGYKADSAGRFLLPEHSLGGITLAYDPNLKNPTTGFRACNNRIDSCLVTRAGREDYCVREAPRCVSATPWKDDPAGDDCCPESCVREYFANRRTQTAAVALSNLTESMCYPGLKAFLDQPGPSASGGGP